MGGDFLEKHGNPPPARPKGRLLLFRRGYSGRKEQNMKIGIVDVGGGLRDSRMEYCVVAADAETGEARYFGKEDIGQDNYDVLKASSSIPFVCRPYPVQGRLYFDGALGDPVPVEKAFSLGCDYVVVLLTKPESVPRSPARDERLAAGIQHRYPAAAHALRQRASRYNAGVYQAQRYAIEGRALIVAPDDTCGVDTLTRDKAALRRLYEKGLSDGAKIDAFLAQIR